MSNSNILRDAQGPEFYHGHVVVGTALVQVEPKGFTFDKGIWLRAPGTSDPTPNTVGVWIGTKTLTANSTPSTGGWVLLPGAELFLPISGGEWLYAISTAASQDLAWLGV